jgi:hypothetical protein
VNIAAGAARDSTNQDDIVLLAPVVVNSAVVGVNGLDTGVLAASTTYYLYIIGDSLAQNPDIDIDKQFSTMAAGSVILNGTVITEGQVTQPTWNVNNNFQPAGLLSLSPTAPNLPLGYDMFRLIGTTITTAGTVFTPFTSLSADTASRLMMYSTPVAALTAGTSATFAAINLTAEVPASAANGTGFVQVLLDVLLTPTAAGNTVAFRPTGSTSTTGNVIMSGDVAAVVHEDQLTVMASVIAGVVSIDYKVTGAVTVNVVGFVNQV